MAVMNIQFYSTSMKREVSLQAILPIDRFSGSSEINLNQDLPLKSLYLLHGFYGSSNDWLYNSQIRELAAAHNLAVFMPSGENHFYVDDVEKNELHGQYIGEELVAFTRAMFPLSTKREDTIIAGLSMGGYGALRNGLKYNHNFGKIIAMSSALVTYRIIYPELSKEEGIAPKSYFPRVFGQLDKVKGSDNDLEALVTQILESNAQMPELYLCCGHDDFLLDVNIRLTEFLNSKNVKHVYEQTPGAHDWNFWREHIELGIKWALKQQ